MMKSKTNVSEELVEYNKDEIFKIVKGYPNYMISNYGRVSSWGTPLKTSPNNHGYPVVQLWRNGQRKIFAIHRLVMLHFGPPCPSIKHIVHHKDSNRQNSHIDNLEWLTNDENQIRAWRDNPNRAVGPRLSKDIVWFILDLSFNFGVPKEIIATIFNTTPRTIQHIRNRKTWRKVYDSFMQHYGKPCIPNYTAHIQRRRRQNNGRYTTT